MTYMYVYIPYIHTHTQGHLKFTTNAPPNLPVPPLYPGEEVQLQEHRVVCTETFNEPAVGALYVTNFRVIFCGNLISVSADCSS